MKRFFVSLGLFVALVCALALSAFAEGEVTVAIDKSRPRAGKAVTATVTPPEGDETVYTVKWYIDNIYHMPGQEDENGKEEGEDKGKTLLTEGASCTPTAAHYEHFLIAEVYAPGSDTPVCSDEMFFSKLPVVYLDLEDGASVDSIQKGTYMNAQMHVQGNDEYKSQYTGLTQIKGRGNTTWGLIKKPYKLKLDKKTDLFGMGKNKHYVLIANYLDPSLMRNKLAYDLSGELGLVKMDSTWVDVIINGEYRGNYQLCEHIRIDEASGRVPVYDWEDWSSDVAKLVFPKPKKDKVTGITPEDVNADRRSALEDQMNEDMSWITSGQISYTDPTTNQKETLDLTESGYDPTAADISGGYLFELSAEYDEVSKFTVSTKSTELKVMVNTPEFLATNQDMMDYAYAYWTAFLNAICSPDGYTTASVDKNGWLAEPVSIHYSELADVDSMAEYFLANELMGNEDAAKKSRYCYKEQGEKLTFGPVWDFDWGCGSFLLDTEYQTSSSAQGWKINHYDENNPANFFKELSDDPWFCAILLEKFNGIRPYLTNMVKDGGLMDSYKAYLQESGTSNTDRWAAYYNGRYGGSFDTDFVNPDPSARLGLKDYLKNRFLWMDDQFTDLPTLMGSLHNENSAAPYEASDTLTFAAEPTAAGGQTVTVTVTHPTTATLDCYVNGVLVGTVPVTEGSAVVTLPASALTAAVGEKNTLSVMGKSTKGDATVQNYTQVTTPQPPAVPVTASLGDDGVTVTVTDPDGQLTGVTYTVYAALYDENGVYQDVVKATGLVFSQSLGDHWKLFLLDEHQAPVCEAVTPAAAAE